MIRSYTYCPTCHTTLHDSVMAFFKRIEHETGAFDEAFMDAQLQALCKRHSKILKEPLKAIYKEVSGWKQPEKTAFCQDIIQSNNIEAICGGRYTPRKFARKPDGFDKVLKTLFLNLYEQVLNGKAFNELHQTSLQAHYITFSRANEQHTLCPLCGISELKKGQEDIREQYDHYVPKATYPFSSVNFNNLVLTCTDCNGFDGKGEDDVVEIGKGHLFFPFDKSHKGIGIELTIEKDGKLEDVIWKITYKNPDRKDKEIEAWRTIYKIDKRYKGFVKARIGKWYKQKLGVKEKSIADGVSEEHFNIVYNSFLKGDEEQTLNFIRKPALDGFESGSVLALAEQQAKYYSS